MGVVGGRDQGSSAHPQGCRRQLHHCSHGRHRALYRPHEDAGHASEAVPVCRTDWYRKVCLHYGETETLLKQLEKCCGLDTMKLRLVRMNS